jgi:hypothetical protein
MLGELAGVYWGMKELANGRVNSKLGGRSKILVGRSVEWLGESKRKYWKIMTTKRRVKKGID